MNPQSAIRNPKWSRRALLTGAAALLASSRIHAAEKVVRNGRLKQ